MPARNLCPPSASCSCVRYGLNTVATPDDILDVVLLLAALALDGFALLALALALQHQRLHRSGSTSGEPERECETPHVCCPDKADWHCPARERTCPRKKNGHSDHYVPLPGSINGGSSINKPGPVDLGGSRLQTIKRALFSTATLLWLLVLAYDACLALDVYVRVPTPVMHFHALSCTFFMHFHAFCAP